MNVIPSHLLDELAKEMPDRVWFLQNVAVIKGAAIYNKPLINIPCVLLIRIIQDVENEIDIQK